MGKNRSNKIYDPGELERVRKNLGNVSREEAKRLADMFGGEVGLERDPEELSQRYKSLRVERKKTAGERAPAGGKTKSPPGRSGSAGSRAPSGSSSPAGSSTPAGSSRTAGSLLGAQHTRSQKSAAALRPRHGYLFRLRFAVLASASEYRIKTSLSRLRAFFSFFLPYKDYINPWFLFHADEQFYTALEGLVIGVRGLVTKQNKSALHAIRRNRDAYAILKTIRDWDINTIHRELSELQKHPRKQDMASLRTICIELYRPIVRLSALDRKNHIEEAFRFAFDKNILEFEEEGKSFQRMKQYYFQAVTELEEVLLRVSQRCLPLLIWFTGDPGDTYRTLVNTKRETLLAFLGLTEEQILTPPPAGKSVYGTSTPVVPGKSGKEKEGETEEKETEGEISGDSEETTRSAGPPPGVVKGLRILNELFPRAGWNRLEEHPDLYAYYHPLFSYPRGFELIAPDDPLQPAVVLLSILQELFYGFRSISFGFLRDERGSPENIEEPIGDVLDSWHLFRDEIINKLYVQRLADYCRQAERSPQFVESKYGKKTEAELLWIKRMYLFPNYKVTTTAAAKPARQHSLPILTEESGVLKDYLVRIALDIEKQVKTDQRGDDGHILCDSVKNPWDRWAFEIENPVSRRLAVLVRDGRAERRTNANLLFYSLSILLVLDYLINQPEGLSYKQNEETPLFRSERNEGKTPQYTVKLAPTIRILQEAERTQKSSPQEAASIQSEAARDETTGFFNDLTLKEQLRKLIRDYHRQNHKEFSVLAVESLPDSASSSDTDEMDISFLAAALKEAAHLPEDFQGNEEIVPFRTGPRRLIILFSGRNTDEVRLPAERILQIFEHRAQRPAFLALVPFHRTWGPEKILRTADLSLNEARKYQPPAGVLFHPQENTCELIEVEQENDDIEVGHAAAEKQQKGDQSPEQSSS
ncbi:MAG: hypothetical protein K9L68_06670 [Spirochaetales bacterium]|nr:hypothetical protein [Spirochaetales bacterium]MCF7938267.1 hypothetical protein [Spirochaetales bacterium]